MTICGLYACLITVAALWLVRPICFNTYSNLEFQVGIAERRSKLAPPGREIDRTAKLCDIDDALHSRAGKIDVVVVGRK